MCQSCTTILKKESNGDKLSRRVIGYEYFKIQADMFICASCKKAQPKWPMSGTRARCIICGRKNGHTYLHEVEGKYHSWFDIDLKQLDMMGVVPTLEEIEEAWGLYSIQRYLYQKCRRGIRRIIPFLM